LFADVCLLMFACLLLMFVSACCVARMLQPQAHFGVAPGCNIRVIEAAQACGLPFAPGITTASELEGAIERGCRFVKFFPAEAAGGLDYLKSIAGPYVVDGLLARSRNA
jgi:2-keto-3-deoxy-6-phosphogluconate aldolase